MRKKTSDAEIRSGIRSIVARYRFDPQRLQFQVAGGTVRLGGELRHHGGTRDGVPPTVIEAFERDLDRARGVGQVVFDLRNWRRASTGEWKLVPLRERAPATVAA